MLGRDHDEQPVDTDPAGGQSGRHGWRLDEPDVDLAGAHQLTDRLGVGHLKAHVQLRVGPAQLADPARHQVLGPRSCFGCARME